MKLYLWCIQIVKKLKIKYRKYRKINISLFSHKFLILMAGLAISNERYSIVRQQNETLICN